MRELPSFHLFYHLKTEENSEPQSGQPVHQRTFEIKGSAIKAGAILENIFDISRSAGSLSQCLNQLGLVSLRRFLFAKVNVVLTDFMMRIKYMHLSAHMVSYELE